MDKGFTKISDLMRSRKVTPAILSIEVLKHLQRSNTTGWLNALLLLRSATHSPAMLLCVDASLWGKVMGSAPCQWSRALVRAHISPWTSRFPR